MRKQILITLLLLTSSTLFAQFMEIKDKHGHRLYHRVEDAKINFVSTPAYEKCGDFLLYESKYYATVSIGTQCWFKENLNVGTKILSNGSLTGANQTNNSIIEKYCYNNDESNCDTYGGLYEWNEAMQYVTTEGTQGICPSGWHIPTYAELQTLDTYVGDQATKLLDVNAKDGYTYSNVTGFSALFAGYRLSSNDSFGTLGSNTYFWSSTETNTFAHFLYLGYSDSDVKFDIGLKANGFSIRCLKD